MTMLQTQSPELYATIQANPTLFMNLILGGSLGAGLPPSGQPGPQGGMPGGQAQAQAQAAAAQNPANRPPGQNVVSVSREELQAIQNLEALGFSRNRAAQAYFACEKNEELAANFLFEQAADDDDDALNQGIMNS